MQWNSNYTWTKYDINLTLNEYWRHFCWYEFKNRNTPDDLSCNFVYNLSTLALMPAHLIGVAWKCRKTCKFTQLSLTLRPHFFSHWLSQRPVLSLFSYSVGSGLSVAYRGYRTRNDSTWQPLKFSKEKPAWLSLYRHTYAYMYIGVFGRLNKTHK